MVARSNTNNRQKLNYVAGKPPPPTFFWINPFICGGITSGL